MCLRKIDIRGPVTHTLGHYVGSSRCVYFWKSISVIRQVTHKTNRIIYYILISFNAHLMERE